MKQLLLNDKDVLSELKKSGVCVEFFDYDLDKPEFRRYNVKVMPTLIFIGKSQWRTNGVSKKDLIKHIRRLAQ